MCLLDSRENVWVVAHWSWRFQTEMPYISSTIVWQLCSFPLRIDYCDARPFCATHIKLLYLF